MTEVGLNHFMVMYTVIAIIEGFISLISLVSGAGVMVDRESWVH